MPHAQTQRRGLVFALACTQAVQVAQPPGASYPHRITGTGDRARAVDARDARTVLELGPDPLAGAFRRAPTDRDGTARRVVEGRRDGNDRSSPASILESGLLGLIGDGKPSRLQNTTQVQRHDGVRLRMGAIAVPAGLVPLAVTVRVRSQTLPHGYAFPDPTPPPAGSRAFQVQDAGGRTFVAGVLGDGFGGTYRFGGLPFEWPAVVAQVQIGTSYAVGGVECILERNAQLPTETGVWRKGGTLVDVAGVPNSPFVRRDDRQDLNSEWGTRTVQEAAANVSRFIRQDVYSDALPGVPWQVWEDRHARDPVDAEVWHQYRQANPDGSTPTIDQARYADEAAQQDVTITSPSGAEALLFAGVEAEAQALRAGEWFVWLHLPPVETVHVPAEQVDDFPAEEVEAAVLATPAVELTARGWQVRVAGVEACVLLATPGTLLRDAQEAAALLTAG